MDEVIINSTQYANSSDLNAMATYILSLQPAYEQDTYEYDNTSTERLNNFKLDKTINLGSVRSFAINQCKGEYISFLDVDDMWSKNKLSIQIPKFKNKRIGVVTSEIVTRVIISIDFRCKIWSDISKEITKNVGNLNRACGIIIAVSDFNFRRYVTFGNVFVHYFVNDLPRLISITRCRSEFVDIVIALCKS